MFYPTKEKKKIDFSKIHCLLCHNNIPIGASFVFIQCVECFDIVHDACHKWVAPKIIEEFEGKQLWKPFCQFCGNNKYEIISPRLWKSPSGEFLESLFDDS